MWEPLQRYNELRPEARQMFRSAAILLPLIGASLRFRGYKSTHQWLQNKLNHHTIAAPRPEELSARVEMTCRMVRAAENYSLLRSSCLGQSLLLWYLLQSQDVAATLRIGVRKQDERFEAHAWVEHNGAALNQAEELHRHYLPFDGEFSKTPAEQP